MSLVGLLSFTSVLLLALSPARSRRRRRRACSRWTPQSLDEIFRTSVPVDGGRWNYIFVHHSRTPGGSAASLARTGGPNGGGMPADHFVIGNGDDAIDGEIQITQLGRADDRRPGRGARPDQRRLHQHLPRGGLRARPPTPTQNLRLAQLVGTLQRRLQISAGRVMLLEGSPAPAGTGRHFPAASFRTQLLP